MGGIMEVLRSYPLLSVALVLTPLVGGFVGAYLGFDNLSRRLSNEKQQQRIESRQETIKTQIEGLSIPIEALRRYEEVLKDQGQRFDVLRLLLSQYEQLQRAVTMREQFIGREDSPERIATAEHILGELRALLGTTQTVPGPGGHALV